ncbi:hypothetical protein F2Q68_00005301 [Brassica cretica]|uniref:Uncharacterized protein n=1 Tax=Brassica cretica TaxID=69181 RepID=A0A8S9JGE1_BRACR|nr:hypothetical protein F2Q68_00005301 [Brassica cretica]
MPSERHASHPPRLDRPRLDLTIPASTHRRNHITATSFRRISEPAEPPPKPSLFFQLCRASLVAQSSACLDSLTCLSAFMMGYSLHGDVSGSENRGGDQSDTATGSERGDADESDRSSTPSRRVRTRVCFDQIDCRPTVYHPVRHPNTIAYPEKFFESAQAIAAHSHLRWPDLCREWIHRQQARIARVDWELRLPCVLSPRKSRLPLFTRKQQRLLDKAIEMDGVPDLSALLKGKLQLLSKKSTTVDPQGPSHSGVDVTSECGGTSREGVSKEGASREEGPIAIDQGGRAETSASGPKKKKKRKKTKVGATDETPPEESASLDATSEGSKAKKKKDGRKRSRGGAASSADRGEGLAEGQEAVLVGAAPGGHPKKRTKRSVEAEPRPSTSDANATDATLVDAVGEASGTPENLSEERRKTSSREGGSGGEPARSAPDSSARKRSGSEGSVAKRRRIEFPDRVEFSYNETTPLILNPLRCAELTRQIRGGTKEMPQLEDLYFKNEYIDAASSRARFVIRTRSPTLGRPIRGASREEGPIAIDQGGRAETSASGPKKKKKSKKTKVGATDETPPEESASLDATSEGSKAKKKKDGRKRSRGGPASSADRVEGLAEGQEAVLVGAAPGGHPKKRTKRSVEAEPRLSTSDANAADATFVDAVGEASGTPENLSEERRKTSSRKGGSDGEPARSAPDSSARKRSGSEGSIAKRRRIEFLDRVEFSYNETTPLILNPLRCAELTRQIRGGRDATIGRPLLQE